jgi:hypothetical protein
MTGKIQAWWENSDRGNRKTAESLVLRNSTYRPGFLFPCCISVGQTVYYLYFLKSFRKFQFGLGGCLEWLSVVFQELSLSYRAVESYVLDFRGVVLSAEGV